MIDPRDDDPIDGQQESAPPPPEESKEHYSVEAFDEFQETAEELGLDAQPAPPPASPSEAIPPAPQAPPPEMPDVAQPADGAVEMPSDAPEAHSEDLAQGLAELSTGPAEAVPVPPASELPAPAADPQPQTPPLVAQPAEAIDVPPAPERAIEQTQQAIDDLAAPAAQPAAAPPAAEAPKAAPPAEPPQVPPQQQASAEPPMPDPGEGFAEYAGRIAELAAPATSAINSGVELIQKAFKGIPGLDQEDERFAERGPQDMQAEGEAAMRDAVRFVANESMEFNRVVVETLIDYGRKIDDLTKALERGRL